MAVRDRGWFRHLRGNHRKGSQGFCRYGAKQPDHRRRWLLITVEFSFRVCRGHAVGTEAASGIAHSREMETEAERHDHALSLRRGALVPAAMDARRARTALRPQDAAVPAKGFCQGISRPQSARHHSAAARWRYADDGICWNFALSSGALRTDAARG